MKLKNVLKKISRDDYVKIYWDDNNKFVVLDKNYPRTGLERLDKENLYERKVESIGSGYYYPGGAMGIIHDRKVPIVCIYLKGEQE